jgi:hypothetical protein
MSAEQIFLSLCCQDRAHTLPPLMRLWLALCCTMPSALRLARHTVLPEIGNRAAATVATQLLNDFPAIRFGLLVGIVGGVPEDEGEDDIRLGDVVVSQPTAMFGGVVQYDLGKILFEWEF